MVSAGTVSVKVVPDVSAFNEKLQSELITKIIAAHVYGDHGPYAKNPDDPLSLCTRITKELMSRYVMLPKPRGG